MKSTKTYPFNRLRLCLVLTGLTTLNVFGQTPSIAGYRFPTPKNGHTRVIAHRGAHTGIPENTLAAYRKAIALGCDFVEIDLRKTKDGKFVSIHNARIDNCVKGKKGKVSDYTLAELKQIDIGSRVGREWKDERIPALEEILELCKGRIGIYLDLKEPYVEELVKIIKHYNMERDIVWYIPASYMSAIKDLQRYCPECIAMPDPGPAKNIRKVAEQVHPEIIATDMNHLTGDFVKLCHERNIKVFVDEEKGNNREWSEILKLDVDGIQTDHPSALISFIMNYKNE